MARVERYKVKCADCGRWFWTDSMNRDTYCLLCSFDHRPPVKKIPVNYDGLLDPDGCVDTNSYHHVYDNPRCLSEEKWHRGEIVRPERN